MGEPKIVSIPYARKSHQNIPLQDLYNKIVDPGESLETIRYSVNLIIYLITIDDKNIFLDAMNFIDNYDTIMHLTSGAQVLINFYLKSRVMTN